MPVEKAKTYESGTFIQLAHTTLSNPNLSWGALGLWHYMLSKPASWKFNRFELENATKNGRYSTSSYLKELAALDLVKKVISRNKQGQITSKDYQVVESSEKLTQSRKPTKMRSPKAEKSINGETQEWKNPAQVNQPPNYIDNKLYIKDLSQEKREKSKREKKEETEAAFDKLRQRPKRKTNMARPKKHPNHKYESVTIYLPPPVKAWLQQEANRHGRPLSGEIAFILNQYHQGLRPVQTEESPDLFQHFTQLLKGIQRVFHL